MLSYERRGGLGGLVRLASPYGHFAWPHLPLHLRKQPANLWPASLNETAVARGLLAAR